ncbi:MAG: hypothetical protein ABI972_32405, partial [Acidobacteriota bacterium]
MALLMFLAVAAVYVPVKRDPRDNAQAAGDYHVLHARRMQFARENLAQRHVIPGWYPRELMGAPFWSNVQSFPLLPTRLIVLALPPPYDYTVGTILGAELAALFTFLFMRGRGYTPLGAAAAGWTFACSGFYAARIYRGELPLLEAYPALPLLLWLVDVNLRAAGGHARQKRFALGGLALASFCLALAGHPQLPGYAFATAGLFVIWCGWGAWRTI